jgi:hypothetical protein
VEEESGYQHEFSILAKTIEVQAMLAAPQTSSTEGGVYRLKSVYYHLKPLFFFLKNSLSSTNGVPTAVCCAARSASHCALYRARRNACPCCISIEEKLG